MNYERLLQFFRSVYVTGRGAIGLAALAAIASGTLVAYTAISATDLAPSPGDEQITLAVNSYIADSDVTVDSADVTIVGSTAAAVGDSPSGIEADTGLSVVNNALTADNYGYTFVVKESGVDAWSTSEDFRIRVFGFDASGPTSTLLATLYMQQASADVGAVEGVTVTVDLGSSTQIYDNFDIIIDRQ